MTVRFYDDDLAVINQYEPKKKLPQRLHAAIQDLKRRIEKENEEKPEHHRGKTNTPRDRSPQDLEDRLATELFLKAMSGQEPFKGLPCHNDCRIAEVNLQVFYCAKDLEPPLTEKKIRYRQISYVDRCRQCIDVHHSSERIKVRMREKRVDSHTGKAKVDWGTAEGLPEAAWF